MVQIVYVVQTFSRDRHGTLTRDAPTWSRDRSFAVSLTQSLAKRKAGVITLGVTVESDEDLGSEAEVVASHGSIPLELILPAEGKSQERRSGPLDLPRKRRA
jgi:hypothetical protein